MINPSKYTQQNKIQTNLNLSYTHESITIKPPSANV